MLSRLLCCGNSKVGSTERLFLLVLGLDNAGKTSIARSLVGQKLDTVAPTVGFNKVETKYRGFPVSIYDVGGSKGFRGIWAKYFHEVHGFIFVVDSCDAQRLDECRETFSELLQNEKVRGKPILLLCNKSDGDEAHDEVHIVDVLNVEHLVNEAKCPTRVEAAAAIKAHGLRVGFKWLLRTIITNLSDLGPRVEADVALERQVEAERRAVILKRIEERRQHEGAEVEEAKDAHVQPPGFVPLARLRKKWSAIEEDSEGENSHADQVAKVSHSGRSSPPKWMRNGKSTTTHHHPAVIDAVSETAFTDVANGVVVSAHALSNGHRDSFPPVESHFETLDLEPISQPKKKTLIRRLNGRVAVRNGSVDSSTYSKPNSCKSSSSADSYRDTQVIKVYTEPSFRAYI